MASTSRNRRRSQRQPGSRTRIWQIVVIALVIITAILVVKLYTSSHAHAVSADGAKSASGELHYPGLEKARYTAAKPAGVVEKDYEGFTVSFNPANHTADWVGWELLVSETDGEVSRSNNFWTDEDIPGCANNYDYRKSGYDKGHLCPAADQKWSERAMSDCFSFANMTPQLHALNAGAWKTLEEKERLWAKRDSAIVIVAGPIYTDSDTNRIGETGVRVPSAFFKVLLAPYIETPRAIGFVYPNMTAPGNMEDYSMTVDEVEEITGLDFFSALPDEIEDKVEKTKSFTQWNRR